MRRLETNAIIDAELASLKLRPCCIDVGDPEYDEVLALAVRAYELPEESVRVPVDPYSEIYVLRSENEIAGTISVCWATRGPLECQPYLPPQLVERFSSLMCEAYRLAVAPTAAPAGVVARLLMRLCFADGLCAGMRLAVACAKSSMVPYYRRVGYLTLREREFEHPRLRVPHVPMICPANSNHPSLFRDLCQGIPDPLVLS